MKILIVEDEPSLRELIQRSLEKERYVVETAGDFNSALYKIEDYDYDCVLLDIMLPDGSGLDLLDRFKALRKQGNVIIISARDSIEDKVSGLDLGADDYIAKPFRPRELVSRIKSVLRRSGRISNVIELADIKIDTTGGKVIKSGEEIFLSALEYRLLLIFAANKGVVLSRNKLLEEIWDASGEFVNDNTLTVYIKRLREKIENDAQKPEIIKTVRGMGYRCL